MKRKKAFTLIELIIVIAVIGVLATIGAFWYVNAQQKARDLHRISIANDIKQALELYYDQNKAYPQSKNCTAGNYGGFNGNWCNSITDLSVGTNRWIASGKLAGFLDNEPVDPKPSATAQFGKSGAFFYYTPANASTWYILAFALEDKGNYSGEDGTRPNKSGTAGGLSALCCRADKTRMYLFSFDPAYPNVATLGNNRGTVSNCDNAIDTPPDISGPAYTCPAS